MSASAVGQAIAAKSPCAARATSSHASLVAKPVRREANVNPATPRMNIRLRPKVSPSLPPSSMNPPKVTA